MHSHSRRGFLTRLLGAGWVGSSLLDQAVLRAAQARAQAPNAPTGLFDLRKVADGVYAALARPAAAINCNSVIFENARDLLVVDTHSKPSAAAALAAQLRSVTPKPVRYVVNTHFHWDHVQGNPAYRKLAPNAEIISSTATRLAMAELGPSRLKAILDAAPEEIEGLERRRASAKTAQEKARIQRELEETRAFVAEMRGYTFELPDITFDENLIIHDRAHDLHLAYRGRAHTAGDIVVVCPQKKIMATGDLLHDVLPFIGDGYPREWPLTLRAVAELPSETFIGGHGTPQPTAGRAPQMRAYLEELTEAVIAGKEAGRTAEELQQKITPATLKSLGGEYGEHAGRELAKMSGGGDPAAALAGSLRENVASTFRALENK